MPQPQAHSMLDRLKFVWLNLWFWTVAPVFTFVFLLGAAVYVTLYQLVFRDWRRAQRLIRRSISHYGNIIVKCGWPLVRVKYQDCAPQETPPFVFICNHPSSSDGFLMTFLPFECVAVLNLWPARVPIMKLIVALAGYLKVREMPFEQFMTAGSKLLAEGCSIIAFPEGTRSGNRPMGQFHGAAFRLAQQNCVKIVPMVVAGNREMPLRGSAWLRPGRVRVTKLPAITPEQYAGMTPFRLKSLVRDTIRRHLQENPA